MHDPSIEQEAPRRGVIVLIFAGMMDAMLSWRGGFALNETYVLLIASGVFLYAIGAMRQGGRPCSRLIPVPAGTVKRTAAEN